jgi:GNAT superfamily N-acetyltransferase
MADEFTIDTRASDIIKVRHVAYGHRYSFYVRPEARKLRLGPVHANTKALLPSAAFATVARVFAEREARKAGLID